MSRDSRRAPASRCLLLWSAVTALMAVFLLLMHTEVARVRATAVADPGSLDFAAALAAFAAVVAGVCAAWLWCVTTAATLEALGGVHAVEIPGARGAVRRLVLAGCGVAVAATVSPAGADDLHGVAGQPPAPTTARAVVATHTVTPGDSLWAITEARLSTDGRVPSVAAVARAWPALWRANAEVVGDDPDLLLPGQRLEIPEALR